MKIFEIKKKIVNHLMVNGEKKTCEKILLQSLKELQKESTKQAKELIKLAITFSTPVFKLHKIENKQQKKKNRKIKEIPSFISSKKARISLAIKFVLEATRKKKLNNFYRKLNAEIFLNVKHKGEAVQIKDELQKQVLLNKRYFYFYRWR
jgi:small subunit ribosomal protein S7